MILVKNEIESGVLAYSELMIVAGRAFVDG